MAKPSRKDELALWWYEYRVKVITLTVITLGILLILAVFYPFSSEMVIGEVRAVTSSDPKHGIQSTATIYSSKTGEVVMVVPFGVILDLGDKVEISQGKTMAGLYRYVFVKKVSSLNQTPQSNFPGLRANEFNRYVSK